MLERSGGVTCSFDASASFIVSHKLEQVSIQQLFVQVTVEEVFLFHTSDMTKTLEKNQQRNNKGET